MTAERLAVGSIIVRFRVGIIAAAAYGLICVILALQHPIRVLASKNPSSRLLGAFDALGYLWLPCLLALWGLAACELVVRRPWRRGERLGMPLAILGSWTVVVALCVFQFLVVPDPVRATVFAIRWGLWSVIAAVPILFISPRAFLRLTAALTLAVAVANLTAISFEVLAGSGWLRPAATVGGVTRQYGLAYNVTISGFQFAMAVLLTAFVIPEIKTRAWRVVFMLLGGACACGIALVGSRAGVVYLVGALVVSVVAAGNARRVLVQRAVMAIVAVCALTAAVVILVPEFGRHLVRVVDLEEPGNRERIEAFRSGSPTVAIAEPRTSEGEQVVVPEKAPVAIPSWSERVREWKTEVQTVLRYGDQVESSAIRMYQHAGIVGLAGLGFLLLAAGASVLWTAPADVRSTLAASLLLVVAFSMTFDLLKSWIGLFYLFSTVGASLAQLSIADRRPGTRNAEAPTA